MNQVGQYNVTFYSECNIDEHGTKYRLLDLSKWSEDKLIKQNFLYINSICSHTAYDELEKDSILDKLIDLPKHTKIRFEIEVKIIKE